MSALVAVLILILLGLVVLVVSAPLRTAHHGEQAGSLKESPGEDPSEAPGRILLDDLEAAREAKYREIRDAEMDFRTGKLSHEDYQATDAQLRAEALEILNRLERDPATGESTTGADGAG